LWAEHRDLYGQDLAVKMERCMRVGVGDLILREPMTRFTFPFNATGQPALALPRGPAEDGLPASMQLVGRRGEDALVLAAGRLFERESLRP
jgi:Asp-tRNA(Asn)/Glu-tRNA(Gln) amidotransferase A subunit family amidase